MIPSCEPGQSFKYQFRKLAVCASVIFSGCHSPDQVVPPDTPEIPRYMHLGFGSGFERYITGNFGNYQFLTLVPGGRLLYALYSADRPLPCSGAIVRLSISASFDSAYVELIDTNRNYTFISISPDGSTLFAIRNESTNGYHFVVRDLVSDVAHEIILRTGLRSIAMHGLGDDSQAIALCFDSAAPSTAGFYLINFITGKDSLIRRIPLDSQYFLPWNWTTLRVVDTSARILDGVDGTLKLRNLTTGLDSSLAFHAEWISQAAVGNTAVTSSLATWKVGAASTVSIIDLATLAATVVNLNPLAPLYCSSAVVIDSLHHLIFAASPLHDEGGGISKLVPYYFTY